jgi:hypothetical protein
MIPAIDRAEPFGPDQTCLNCKYWLRKKAVDCKLVMTQHGPNWAPAEQVKAEAAKQGQMAQYLQAETSKVAPCAYTSNWATVDEKHFCAQWQPSGAN